MANMFSQFTSTMSSTASAVSSSVSNFSFTGTPSSSTPSTSTPVSPTLSQTSTPSKHPTLTFAIPFPEVPACNKSKHVPPFLLYAPLPAPHAKPEEGEKEGIQKRAERTWQEHEREARDQVQKEGKEAPMKAKMIGHVSKAMSWTKSSKIEYLSRTPSASELKAIAIVYPSNYPAEEMQDKFTAVLKATKNAAIRNGIIATALLPVVLVFDTVTFIPGPFEINAVFAVASWTGASRASSISNGVANNKVSCSFLPDNRLDHFAYRLHELCWELRKPTVPMEAPRWSGEHEPLRGVELAALALALVNVHLDLGADTAYERDLERLSEDLEDCLKKGAREWLAAIA